MRIEIAGGLLVKAPPLLAEELCFPMSEPVAGGLRLPREAIAALAHKAQI
jgi:hypothetical protein